MTLSRRNQTLVQKNVHHIFFLFAVVTLAASRSSMGVLKTAISFTAGEKVFLGERFLLKEHALSFLKTHNELNLRNSEKQFFLQNWFIGAEKKNRVGKVIT